MTSFLRRPPGPTLFNVLASHPRFVRDLAARGITEPDRYVRGTRTIVLAWWPDFWGLFLRVLTVDDGIARLHVAKTMYLGLGRELVSAPVADIRVRTHLGGRRAILRFPQGHKMTVAGRKAVELATRLLAPS